MKLTTVILALAARAHALAITNSDDTRNTSTVQIVDPSGRYLVTVNTTVYQASVARLEVAQQAINEGALTKRTVAQTQSYPIGCFDDNPNYRTLKDDAIYSDDMTIESCQAYCSSKSSTYDIFGVQYGRECYCGSGLRNGLTTSGTCNMPCAGNTGEICGGGNTLSVYTTNYRLAVSIMSNPEVSQLGCFQDFYGYPTNFRVLDGANYQSDSMTMESCSSFCLGRGYAFGGVEYGRECYCGSTAPTQSSDACTMSCGGNSNEICGGGNALNVFQNKFAIECTFNTLIAGLFDYYTGYPHLIFSGYATPADCLSRCVANPACITVQYGNGYCNNFNAPYLTVRDPYSVGDTSYGYGFQEYSCRA